MYFADRDMAIKSVPPPQALLLRTRLIPRPFMMPPKTDISRISPVMGTTGSSSTRIDTVSRQIQDRIVNFFPTSRYANTAGTALKSTFSNVNDIWTS